MTDFRTIEFSVDDRVATIILNRPDAANCLTELMAEELGSAALLCDHNDDVKCVVITGSGLFFCAGGDISTMARNLDTIGTTIKGLANSLHTAISTFARMDSPVIMAVNGIAAGAGMSLAASGDIVLASEEASFLMAYTKSGLSPDGSSSYFLPRVIGMRRTQELMLTNRQLTAAEALSWGLVTDTVPSEDLMERAREYARSISEGSKGANAAVKRLLLASFGNGLETQMELEGRQIASAASSPDGLEGISAFMEKRKPSWTA